MERLAERAVALLTDQSQDPASREAAFRDLLRDGFAIRGVARFVLGRYWRTASDEERERFTSLFEDYIVKTYSARFSGYSGQALEVLGERESTNSVLVQSRVRNPGDVEIKVEWRVQEDDGELVVTDVIVEGVSMALTQRSDFAAVIRNRGGQVSGLNEELRMKIDDLSRESAADWLSNK